MNVRMYNFEKRKNSTKQPVVTDATMFSVTLKDSTSVLNPTLLFNPGNAGFTNPFNPSQFNYCHIPYFSRYYFVRDWRFLNGVWECDLMVDVLASFKTAIGLTSSYILRSASAYDGTVMDGKYPGTSSVAINRIAVANVWHNIAPSGGCYVVGIINNIQQGNIGSVCYYVLTSSLMAQLLSFMFSDSIFNASSINEIGEGLFKSIFNPFQYIVSATWMPFALNSIASSTDANIYVGYWNSGINAPVLGSLVQSTNISSSAIPAHPQSSRGEYLNYSPFTTMTLYIEPFGCIPIDTSYYNIGDYLYGTAYIDNISGDALLRVGFTENIAQGNNTRIFAERTGKIGIPIQLAQVASDYIGTISGGIQALSGLVSMNPIGVASGIMNALESSAQKVSTSGANGSWALLPPVSSVVVEHRYIVSENNSELGRPLMATRTINTLSGFIQCGEADHAFSSFGTENDDINNYLSSGFFYE